jgi:hypothetical protein
VFAAEFKQESDLEQGDVCIGLAIPVITDDAQAVDANGKQAPWDGEAKTTAPQAFFLRVTKAPLIVLSQSCDLVGDSVARVLVAPLVNEQDPRFTAQYQKAVSDMLQTAGKDFVTRGNTDLAKVGERLETTREAALKRLRLGEIPNAFPVKKASGNQWALPSSVCFFDNATSLPGLWLPALKRTRRLRLNTVWQSVLQEALGRWLGRYAYPGSLADRLRVFEDASVDQPE